MNAQTCEDLVFTPRPGIAKSAEAVSIPVATDVFYDGTKLLASIDGVHDYEYAKPAVDDFLLNQLTTPQLQNLAVMVCNIREEWQIDKVMTQLRLMGNVVTLPELAKAALTVATNPRYKVPESIRAMAAGWYAEEDAR